MDQTEDGLCDVWLDADPETVPAAAAGDRGLAAVSGAGIGVVIRNLMSGGMRRVTRNITLFEIMGGIHVFHCPCSWTLTSPKQAAHPRAVNQLLVVLTLHVGTQRVTMIGEWKGKMYLYLFLTH